MRQKIILIAISVTVVFSLTMSRFASAQELIPQERLPAVDAIESRCDSITTDLRQLHTSDSLTRVNIGQAYSRISLRFMARLNSRLALNSIDSVSFVELSSEFDEAKKKFTTDYSAYESALSSLIKIDCHNKPMDFYAQLITTRQLRQNLLGTTARLNEIMSRYRAETEQLRDSYAGGQ